MKLMTKKNFTYAFLNNYGDKTNLAYDLYSAYANSGDGAHQKMIAILMHAYALECIDTVFDELEKNKNLSPKAKQDLLERMYNTFSKNPSSIAGDAV